MKMETVELNRIETIKVGRKRLNIQAGSLKVVTFPADTPGEPPVRWLSGTEIGDEWDQREFFVPLSAVQLLANDWVDYKGDDEP